MTGFGAGKFENEALLIRVEMRSLNGKFNEVNLRLPKSLHSQEAILKTKISQWVNRGTVQTHIFFQRRDAETAQTLFNEPLLSAYIRELKTISQKENVNPDYFLSPLINLPDVLSPTDKDLSEEEIALLHQTTEHAFHELDQFRKTEGQSIKEVFIHAISFLKEALKEVDQLDKPRVEKIRNRIAENLQSVLPVDKIDPTRFEAEMIYYIEKIDISEEKNRLAQHLDFFEQTLNEAYSGKKLGFIAQEIGREINTIGSKANDFGIQQKVVGMKDELEKIREQVLNVV